MLKLIVILFFQISFAKQTVLIGYFHPFGKSSINNSQLIAQELIKINLSHDQIDFSLCEIPSVYEKSYEALLDCLKKMKNSPDLVLGLGEADCNLKLETILKNLDQNDTPDNVGNIKKKEKIIENADEFLSLNYPLKEAYCELSEKDQDQVEVSYQSGGFICNHFAFKTRYFEEDLKFGFIHVPSHKCKDLPKRNLEDAKIIYQLIISGLAYPSHPLPLLSQHIELLKERSKKMNSKCGEKFYKQIKGIDQLSFWPFSLLP